MTNNNDSMRTPNEMASEPFVHSRTEPLTEEQTKHALVDNHSHYLGAYPRVERKYADPAIPNQNFALVSFVPSKGAKPDAEGIYGVAKLRGVFSTLSEADERAEFLIRNVDSVHPILTTYVGRPFPVIETGADKFGGKLNEIDIENKMETLMATDEREKKVDEEKTIREIKEREEKLKQDVKVEEADKPVEEAYCTARVKLAQLLFVAKDYRKRIDEIKPIASKTYQYILEAEAEHPDIVDDYLDRYKSARTEAGLSNEAPDFSFVNEMVASAKDLEELMQM